MNPFKRKRKIKKQAFTAAMVQAWFESFLTQRFGVVTPTCTEKTRFTDLGLDSMDAVVMAGLLEDALGRQIEPEIFLTHTCLADVISLLSQRGFLVQDDKD